MIVIISILTSHNKGIMKFSCCFEWLEMSQFIYAFIIITKAFEL